MALKVIMTGLKSLGLYTKFYNIDRSNIFNNKILEKIRDHRKGSLSEERS